MNPGLQGIIGIIVLLLALYYLGDSEEHKQLYNEVDDEQKKKAEQIRRIKELKGE